MYQSMYNEFKVQIKEMKKEIAELKKGQSCTTSNMDDLESLFSSLDGKYSPFPTVTQLTNSLSPPPISPPFQFRVRANSVPLIFLSGNVNVSQPLVDTATENNLSGPT